MKKRKYQIVNVKTGKVEVEFRHMDNCIERYELLHKDIRTFEREFVIIVKVEGIDYEEDI